MHIKTYINAYIYNTYIHTLTSKRQTHNQQNRKPSTQQADRHTFSGKRQAHNQQTTNPANQQTNTTTRRKSRDAPPNLPKGNQKINHKSTKMIPKSVLEAAWGAC